MTQVQDAVRRGQARWNRALLLGLTARGVGFGLLAAGCAVLIGRGFGLRIEWLAGGAGLLGGLAWAVWRYRERRVDEAQMLTLLDLRAGGTGGLLHAFETGAPGADLSTASTRPRPAWRRTVAPALLPGLLFFALGLAMPVRAIAPSPAEAYAEARLDELEQLAETLEETLDLEEELEEEIQRNLDTLRGTGEEPKPTGEAMREALDALEARLDEVAEQAAAELEEVVRTASEAAQQGASPDPETHEQALDGLGDLVEQSQEMGLTEGPELDPKLLEQLAEAALDQNTLDALQELAKAGRMAELGNLAESLELTPEQIARLAEALAEGLSDAALEKLAEMAKNGLLDPSAQQPGESGADPEKLAEYLERMQQQPQPGGT